MVSQKRYMPTNKRFQDHTKMFVGTKTKKGHLNAEDKEKENTLTEGTLVRVLKAKIYEDGWEVRVGKSKTAKTYMCSYGDNIMYLPESNETELYYVPKHECSVQVSIDTKTKLYFITKINDPNKQPISMTADKISIQGNGSSAIEVTTDTVKAVGELLSDKDVVVDSGDEKISLKGVNEEINSIKTDGIKTIGDIVITTDDDSSDISLKETNNQLKDMKENGLETKGDVVIHYEKEETKKISLLDLYNEINDLKQRIDLLEQNNG